jgi:hypothetical protein
MLGEERFFMRTAKIAGLILAGLLAVSSTAFAGGGGGGHSGGSGFGGGGHSGGGGFGGGGHSGGGGFGGGGHFGGAGHFGSGGHFGGGGHFGSTGHFATGHFTGGHYGYVGHDGYARHYGSHYYWRDGRWYGGPYAYSDYPFGIGIDDYGYYNDAPYAYTDDQGALDDSASFAGTVLAAQKELAKLGYYHGTIDGLIGPETEKAIRWFQSVDKLPVTGVLNDQTLKALQIS